MSFKLFVYYCAVCGGWAAFLGWCFSLPLMPEENIGRALVRGMCVGMAVALGLSLVDGFWNLTARQLGKVAVRGLVGTGVGLVASLPGAYLGQVLVNATHVDALALVGWTLTGLLIGMSIGIYDTLTRAVQGERMGGSLRKVSHGTLGGLVGGLLGGTLYVLIRSNLRLGGKDPDDLLSSSAIGFVVLGICIGLFVALAQVILKEAWVRVEAGFRAGREMILSKDETTIGRAESCDIGLFGDTAIEKMHARIVLKGTGYLLADAGTPGGTFLNDRRIAQPTPLRSGDLIRVGKSVMRFSERHKRVTSDQ